MRIDLLLYRCRFAKSRSVAQQLVEKGHLRVNSARVLKPSHSVGEGDILTLPRGSTVVLVELLALPDRRGPAAEASLCYRVLDRDGPTALAAEATAPTKGNSPP